MTDEPCTPEQIEKIIAEARYSVERLKRYVSWVDNGAFTLETEAYLGLPRERWYELWELL